MEYTQLEDRVPTPKHKNSASFTSLPDPDLDDLGNNSITTVNEDMVNTNNTYNNPDNEAANSPCFDEIIKELDRNSNEKDCNSNDDETTLVPEGYPKSLMEDDPESDPEPKPKRRRRSKSDNRKKVQHDYADYSVVDEDMFALKFSNLTKRGGVITPFPLKLHKMLDMVQRDELTSIVSWQPHGRAFLVHKTKEFVQIILPTYFKQSKLTSFQRQLNLYGFRRLTQGQDCGAYYHQLFLYGKPKLTYGMVRVKVKGTGCKAANNPDNEPNFYMMPPLIHQRRRTGSQHQSITAELPGMVTVANPFVKPSVRDRIMKGAFPVEYQGKLETLFYPVSVISGKRFETKLFHTSPVKVISNTKEMMKGDEWPLNNNTDSPLLQELRYHYNDDDTVVHKEEVNHVSTNCDDIEITPPDHEQTKRQTSIELFNHKRTTTSSSIDIFADHDHPLDSFRLSLYDEVASHQNPESNFNNNHHVQCDSSYPAAAV